VLWSILFWAGFDFMTTACGLYARALLPALPDPVYAFPRLAEITLPPWPLGFFYLGMIATVMSTIDSYAFIAATTVGRDLVWRVRGGDPGRIPAWSRRRTLDRDRVRHRAGAGAAQRRGAVARPGLGGDPHAPAPGAAGAHASRPDPALAVCCG
jgi:hypothetical protein